MKSIYIVDYWVPFPSSEYGGTINVIAENDNECHDLLLAWSEESGDSRYHSKIMERVVNAHKFPLANDEESRIVDYFTT